jgi:RimJ/RimL family protein N-acetyltransferase
MTKAIPVIETDRLILREWQEADFDAYAAMVRDPEVMRYLGGPQSREEAWRGLAMMLGHWMLRDFGLWAVIAKEDGRLVGRVGLQYPAGWPGAELTWMLGRAQWGCGYATEAAAAAARFARALPSRRHAPIALIHPENMASKAVAERLSFRKMRNASLTLYGQSHEREIWQIGTPQAADRS